MKKIIEKSKNLFLIAVASTLLASVIGFLWVELIELMDILEARIDCIAKLIDSTTM